MIGWNGLDRASTRSGSTSTASDEVITLQEGNTPLLCADRLSERLEAERLAEVRGTQPLGFLQGPRDDHGDHQGQGQRGQDGDLRLDRQHVGRGRGLRRARPAWTAWCSCPRARSRWASSPRRSSTAPRSSRSAATSTRRSTSRASCTQHLPITIVNSINPDRIEGQKTGAFEIVDVLGKAPGHPLDPGGQRRQHHRLLARLHPVPLRRRREDPAQDVGLPGGGRRADRARPPRRRTPRPSPRRSASATPRAGCRPSR